MNLIQIIVIFLAALCWVRWLLPRRGAVILRSRRIASLFPILEERETPGPVKPGYRDLPWCYVCEERLISPQLFCNRAYMHLAANRLNYSSQLSTMIRAFQPRVVHCSAGPWWPILSEVQYHSCRLIVEATGSGG